MVSLIKKFYVAFPGGGGGLPPSPSKTPSITRTPSITPSVTRTPSVTPSLTKTPSVTPTPSITPSPTAPPGASNTPSVTPSLTPSVTVSPTPTSSATPSTTPSVSATPSSTISVSTTPSISKTPTPTPTPSPTADCSQMNIFSQMQQAALQFMKTDIAYYKHNLHQTKRNIYGESLEKWYYQPFLIKCTISRNADSIKDEMFGPDVDKTAKITIPRVAWEQGNAGLIQGANVLPEIGDIILDRSTERYYEVNTIIHDYVPVNANISLGQTSCPQTELVTFNLECHQTRVSRLNLSPYKVL
jgi:hypothetical protein